MSGSMRKPHAVVFPIPLQGHINPMMLLAKHLHSSGIRVTFLLPERTLSILLNNNKSNKRTAHEDFAEGPRHPRHVDDTHHTTCQAECIILNNIKYSNKHKNGAIKVHEGIQNNYTQKNDNDMHDCDGHKNDKPSNSATDVIDGNDNYHIHLGNTLPTNSNKIHDDDDGGDHEDHDDGYVHGCNEDDDGGDHEGDDDGYVYACNEDIVPPIQFETLPNCSSPEHQALPMSSYVLIFLNAMPLLKRKLEELLERMQQKGQPATCIISDSFVPWTQDVANEFGIPRMEFWSSSVTVYSMGYHIPQLIDRGYLPVHPGDGQEFCIDIIPGLAPFRVADFFYDLHPHAISSPVFDLICKAFSRSKEAQRVLVNSFDHLEKGIIEALQAEGVSICPVGPLLPLQMCAGCTEKQHRSVEEMGAMSTSLYAEDEDCLEWLDTQEESSVIYVSFGSLACISKEEMEELMLGLEGSQQPYLLVIRPDMVSGLCVQNALRGRGRICAWVSQIRVLGHPAVGGFLTHCGWNSIMEGSYMGVPMIGCARESEQHTNLKCLRDEWKVAMALEDVGVCKSREMGGAGNRVQIKKELVEGAIRALMREEEGMSLRKRMQGLQEAAQRAAHKGSSLQTLIHDIRNN